MNNKAIKIISILTFNFQLLTFNSRPVHAAINIGEAFKFGTFGVDKIFPSASSLINVLIPNIFMITGLVFLLILIFAGFGFILNSSNGDAESAKKAKGAATSAAIGLFLVIGAYWLIRIIEVITGLTIFNSIL